MLKIFLMFEHHETQSSACKSWKVKGMQLNPLSVIAKVVLREFWIYDERKCIEV